MGSKKTRKGQEGMTTVPRAGDGYGPAEHRLMGYDRERLGGGAAGRVPAWDLGDLGSHPGGGNLKVLSSEMDPAEIGLIR